MLPQDAFNSSMRPSSQYPSAVLWEFGEAVKEQDSKNVSKNSQERSPLSKAKHKSLKPQGNSLACVGNVSLPAR